MLKLRFLIFTVFSVHAIVLGHEDTLKSSRSGSYDGSFTPADVNDARVKEIASFAIDGLTAENSELGPFELVRIIAAEKQVVGGTNYRLRLKLKTVKDDYLKCQVIVFDQAWTKTRKIVETKCRTSNTA